MSTDEFKPVWAEPPTNRTDKARRIVFALRERPGSWARVAESVTAAEAFEWRMEFTMLDAGLEVRVVRRDPIPLAAILEPLRRYDVYARTIEGTR